MMTRVDYAEASGINGVEWDFVEVSKTCTQALP
jgi:oligopeptidase A